MKPFQLIIYAAEQGRMAKNADAAATRSRRIIVDAAIGARVHAVDGTAAERRHSEATSSKMRALRRHEPYSLSYAIRGLVEVQGGRADIALLQDRIAAKSAHAFPQISTTEQAVQSHE